jgi:hypothetical protein
MVDDFCHKTLIASTCSAEICSESPFEDSLLWLIDKKVEIRFHTTKALLELFLYVEYAKIQFRNR